MPLARFDRIFEPRLHCLNIVDGAPVLGFQIALLAFGENVGYQVDLMSNVIEHEQTREEHHHCVIEIYVRDILFRNVFEPANGIVADVTDRAANKRSQIRDSHRNWSTRQPPENRQHGLIRFLLASAGFNCDVASSASNHDVRIESQERMARHLFAAFHRFEQK